MTDYYRFNEKVEKWVNDILSMPKNIASEIELQEQAKAAFNLFVQADIDGSESLSFIELKTLCDLAGLPMEDDEEEVLAKMDSDDSGCLDIEEWVKWWLGRISTLPNPMKQQEAIARNTFRKFDVDGSGFLDSAELGRLTAQLGADFTEEELEEALAEIDADSSGSIEVTEFISWWTNRASANRSNTSLISLKMRKLALRAAQVFTTDIFAASWNGDVELVKAFLLGESRLAQASDSTEYGEGWTALHYACYQGHVAVVQVLLGERADVNRTNDLGFSALFYAAQRGHIDVCSLLMDAGADPSITGVYQPIGLLESDGPPSLNAHFVDQKFPDEIFMCPVEHIIDFPGLRPIFQGSAKCAVPQVPDYDKVVASVSVSSGELSFEVQQPQKAISHLPVKQWELKLRMDMQMDTDLVPAEVYADLVAAGLSIAINRLPAVHPKQPQTYSVPLDRVWIKKLHFLCMLHRMKRLQLLEASLAGLEGIWRELSTMYNTIDPVYRSGINLIDFVYMLINKSPDRKNTKELRHSLRASLELVAASKSLVAEAHEAVDGRSAPGKEANKSGTSGANNVRNVPKRGLTESKSQEPEVYIDLTDPVAKLNAAVKGLQEKKLAADLARLTEKQASEDEERRKKRAADAGSAANTAGPDSSAGTQQQGDAELTVKWVLREDNQQTGFPTVSLSLSAVNAWGAGDFSSSIFVSIVGVERSAKLTK